MSEFNLASRWVLQQQSVFIILKSCIVLEREPRGAGCILTTEASTCPRFSERKTGRQAFEPNKQPLCASIQIFVSEHRVSVAFLSLCVLKITTLPPQ